MRVVYIGINRAEEEYKNKSKDYDEIAINNLGK